MSSQEPVAAAPGRRLRGLHAKFIAVISIAMLVVLAVVAVMWQRQTEMQREVLRIGQDSTRELVSDRLRDRGEAQVKQLADLLANPLYYFDLDAIGDASRSVLRQPDVAYVQVYDAEGNVVHDGSGDIATFGQRMRDPLAQRVISADALLVASHGEAMDVSMPIRIGDQRLGGVRVGYSLDRLRGQELAVAARIRAALDEIGNRHLAWIALLLLSLFALFVVVGAILERTLVDPIRRLAAAARRIEAGDFSSALPRSAHADEVGSLVDAFARMAASIDRNDREMRRMAYADALTGLANRQAFREALDLRLLEARGVDRQIALLFADLDDFKRVNDTLGHDVGDEVLVQCAARIRAVVERIGGERAMLARFGGDEFVIMLQADHEPGGDVRAAASRLAEHLVAELGRPFVTQDRQVFLGSSIGVTVFPDDASSATMLMKNGDIAMYQAKLSGKHCYRYYNRAMDQAVSRRVRIEHDLRGAWERGELTLVYQPLYRMQDRRLVGAEALLRWQHPVHGAVAPSVFVDVAEQSGLIEIIGPQVLRRACTDAMRWRGLREDCEQPFVSVNVSARQLRSVGFRERIVEALEDSGLSPTFMHLELTETAVLADEVQAREVLGDLRDRGVHVWLDDFGTGFSGLSHLRRVPVDGVKIDRSFIADMQRDPDDLALTTAIIAMAHSLGMIVVAEGVEKQGQAELLRDRACDLAQGFWFGHPLTAAQFEAMLSEESATEGA